MKVLGIVPARGGSKRLPRKNVLPLGGKPLVRWAIDCGRAAQAIDRLVVSSDDPEVLAVAGDLGIERPAAFATDTSPAIDYVKHALSVVGGDWDAIVILQPSSPLTLPSDVDATVRLLESSGADSAVTVMKVDHAIHPVKLKTLDGDRLKAWWEEERGRMAAHELPELYVRNCAVYATRRRVVEAGAIIGEDCRAVVMPRERSVDINEELDLAFAEFLVARS
jgi:CMP-N-acetylneuraminic acid synthetase